MRERRARSFATDALAAGEGPLDAGPAEKTPRRPLSAAQIRAIFDAMRTFRDDDLSRTGGEDTFTCNRCERRRQSAGSVMYGALRLCNGCATDYELLRTAGMERDILVFTRDAVAINPTPATPTKS